MDDIGRKNVDRILGPSVSVIVAGQVAETRSHYRRRKMDDDDDGSASSAVVYDGASCADPLGRPARAMPPPMPSMCLAVPSDEDDDSSSSSIDESDGASSSMLSHRPRVPNGKSARVRSEVDDVDDRDRSLENEGARDRAASKIKDDDSGDAVVGCSLGCFSDRAKRIDMAAAIIFSVAAAALAMFSAATTTGVGGESGWLFALVEAMVPFVGVALMDATWRRRCGVARLGIIVGFGFASIASVVTGVTVGMAEEDYYYRPFSAQGEGRSDEIAFCFKGGAFVAFGLYVGIRCCNVINRSTDDAPSGSGGMIRCSAGGGAFDRCQNRRKNRGKDEERESSFALSWLFGGWIRRKPWRARTTTARQMLAPAFAIRRDDDEPLIRPDGSLDVRKAAREKEGLDATISDRYTVASTWTHAIAVLVVFMDVMTNGGVASHPLLTASVAASMFVPTVVLATHLYDTAVAERKMDVPDRRRIVGLLARSACLLCSVWALVSIVAQLASGIVLPIVGVVGAFASGKVDFWTAVRRRGQQEPPRRPDASEVPAIGEGSPFGALYALCGDGSVSPSDCALLSLKTYLAILGSMVLCFVSARLLFDLARGRRRIGSKRRAPPTGSVRFERESDHRLTSIASGCGSADENAVPHR